MSEVLNLVIDEQDFTKTNLTRFKDKVQTWKVGERVIKTVTNVQFLIQQTKYVGVAWTIKEPFSKETSDPLQGTERKTNP